MPKDSLPLRDRLAASALSGLLAWDNPAYDQEGGTWIPGRYFNSKWELRAEDLAGDAYEIADAMLEARKK